VLSIDFGSSTIKAAARFEEDGPARLLEFGEERNTTIPSVFYVPRSGPIAVGQQALSHIAADPRGSVRHLKQAMHLTTYQFRNHRRIAPRDLAATAFHLIRESLRDRAEVAGCILPLPATFSFQQRDAMASAAMLGGFTQVEIVESAAAAVTHWVKESAAVPDYVFVLDLGGGQSELTLVERSRGTYRVSPDLQFPPGPGVEAIDGMLWDALRGTIDEGQWGSGDFLRLRDRLAYAKQEFSSSTASLPASAIMARHESTSQALRSVTLDTKVIEACLQRFYADALAALQEAEDFCDSIGKKSLVLLVVGGGANLAGLDTAIRAQGWRFPIGRPTNPLMASVLGAAEGASPLQKAALKKSPQTKTTLRPRQSPESLQNPAAGKAITPIRAGISSEGSRCPEPGCGAVNSVERMYCHRCGSPLPAAEID
jgi:hypothetical protein